MSLDAPVDGGCWLVFGVVDTLDDAGGCVGWGRGVGCWPVFGVVDTFEDGGSWEKQGCVRWGRGVE